MQVQLQPPRYLADKEPIEIWIIHAKEDNPPPGEDPVEWFLLTTMPITNGSDAEQCLRWYCLRWRIEDWHRVLKSGCRIEEIAHKTAARLRRAIAINLVIAWRIMVMTLLGREQPELPAGVRPEVHRRRARIEASFGERAVAVTPPAAPPFVHWNLERRRLLART